MERIRQTARVGLVAIGLVVTMLTPAGVFAADGEIGDVGDTDSITDVFVSGGRPAVNIDYLRDCPAAGINDCWIEVSFRSRCPEIWCNWVAQSFRRIPASGAARGDCLGAGNEDNEWEAHYRTAYTASAVKKVQWRGEVELVTTIAGNATYRLIAEAMFNVTGGVGFIGATLVETVTAQSDYGPTVSVASSGGRDLVTC